ncbi:MAG: hypothetical protein LBS17_07055 [Actinomycetes bacterium]|jgi:hypothetical protein|nr:hypothetical protein [Actinomycetes bacterium]
MKRLLRFYADPVTRPRAIIVTGTAIMCVIMFALVMVFATTSYWFCAEICHSVQDDSISAYKRSTHSQVSCVSCHMPVGANPVVFLLHKVEALGELPPTITGTFEVPLNPASRLAMSEEAFPPETCLQCHRAVPDVTPSFGLQPNHEIHADHDLRCTFCHNRVAHSESGEWEPQTVNPRTGESSWKHVNYISMAGCFRCHGQKDGAPASGECTNCHVSYHDLRPADHKVDSWKTTHSASAIREQLRVSAVVLYYANRGVDAKVTPARKVRDVALLDKEEKGRRLTEEEKETQAQWPLAPMSAVERCTMCHLKVDDCDPCHQVNRIHVDD